MADRVSITSGALTAAISPHGAELQSLTDAQGREYMSSGDPAYWAGRAPLLFPVVGRLNGDTLRLGGATYTMEKHGFARKFEFDLIAAGEDHALFRLTDSEATRANYPFAFALDAAFRITNETLHMAITVRNTGNAPLPFSFGYHPAFAWPLPTGGARDDHAIFFERDEPAHLCAITPDGLIGPSPVPTPVQGNRILLDDALFAHDALVWNDLGSHSLIYGAPGFDRLAVSFPDTDWLGIWTKPGAPFVCIEPWAGMADPQGYDGNFTDKPGVMTLMAGMHRTFRMDVSLLPRE